MRPFSASHASSQSVMVATATPVLSRASRMASRASLDNCFGSLAIQTRPDHPTEEMPKPHDHGQESYRIPTSRRFTKSLIPRMRAVLRRASTLGNFSAAILRPGSAISAQFMLFLQCRHPIQIRNHLQKPAHPVRPHLPGDGVCLARRPAWLLFLR